MSAARPEVDLPQAGAASREVSLLPRVAILQAFPPTALGLKVAAEPPAILVVDGVRQSLEQKVGLSRARTSVTTRLFRIVRRSQLASGNGLRQRE